jgi:hypothetical protein
MSNQRPPRRVQDRSSQASDWPVVVEMAAQLGVAEP